MRIMCLKCVRHLKKFGKWMVMEKNGNKLPHELFKVGDWVTFQCGDTLKEGVVLIVDAHGTFESPNTRSYDIMVENENMLYKHVKCDLVKSKTKR